MTRPERSACAPGTAGQTETNMRRLLRHPNAANNPIACASCKDWSP